VLREAGIISRRRWRRSRLMGEGRIAARVVGR
jgi:hypothetical protein